MGRQGVVYKGNYSNDNVFSAVECTTNDKNDKVNDSETESQNISKAKSHNVSETESQNVPVAERTKSLIQRVEMSVIF